RGTFAVVGAWQAAHAAADLMARFATPPATTSIDAGEWWQGSAWLALPAQRKERDAGRRWPLDLQVAGPLQPLRDALQAHGWHEQPQADRKSTRLNSSHVKISYAVFVLKKKNTTTA